MKKFFCKLLAIVCVFSVVSACGLCGTATVAAKGVKAVTSTRVKPLKKGQWGICSKYNASTSKYQNVNVSVTKFIRGNTAKAMVKKFCKSPSSIYKYNEPKKGMEWVVVNYSILFNKFKVSSLGVSPSVTVNVCSKATPNCVEFKGAYYIISATEITNHDDVKGKGGSSAEAFQMPVGCTNYVVQFGDYKQTNAFFQGA